MAVLTSIIWGRPSRCHGHVRGADKVVAHHLGGREHFIESIAHPLPEVAAHLFREDVASLLGGVVLLEVAAHLPESIAHHLLEAMAHPLPEGVVQLPKGTAHLPQEDVAQLLGAIALLPPEAYLIENRVHLPKDLLRHSTSPIRQHSLSPPRKRSLSPIRGNSPSSSRDSPSPILRLSPSPMKHHSPSPPRRHSPPPSSKRVPSPRRLSPSSPPPSRRHSPSSPPPPRRHSPSSPAPRRRSPSSPPPRRHSPSPLRKYSPSPCRQPADRGRRREDVYLPHSPPRKSHRDLRDYIRKKEVEYKRASKRTRPPSPEDFHHKRLRFQETERRGPHPKKLARYERHFLHKVEKERAERHHIRRDFEEVRKKRQNGHHQSEDKHKNSRSPMVYHKSHHKNDHSSKFDENAHLNHMKEKVSHTNIKGPVKSRIRIVRASISPDGDEADSPVNRKNKSVYRHRSPDNENSEMPTRNKVSRNKIQILDRESSDCSSDAEEANRSSTQHEVIASPVIFCFLGNAEEIYNAQQKLKKEEAKDTH
ncbi:hypothetical protein B566_EDAN014089 [Ephemera danica]|nr:hypothetical protein B566_EDAN014089 [Ephemera danica]